jgi:hypothetical protein
MSTFMSPKYVVVARVITKHSDNNQHIDITLLYCLLTD